MHDQYIWVMSGLLEFDHGPEDERETEALKAGSAVTIPRGQIHTLNPVQQSSMMVMFRPPASGEVPDAQILTSMMPDTNS